MIHFLKSWWRKNPAIGEEKEAVKKYLIAGLGNIGPNYTGTRHNIGFQILDHLATKQQFGFNTQKLGDMGTFRIKGRQILCLKPSTYMNLSGKAVKYWMEKEKIPQEQLLVVTDDINLPFGTLRLKTSGSDGGHNGLKDIQGSLQTMAFNRLRFGVGAGFEKGRQADFVLSSWNDEEFAQLLERLDRANELILSFVLAGVSLTMNQYNNT